MEATPIMPITQGDQTQVQTETNLVENGGEQYNMGDYANNGEVVTTTTTDEVVNDYGTGDNMGNVDAYGTGGLEVIEQNTTGQQLNVEDIVKDTQIRTSVNQALVNETTKETLVTTRTLPVKVLEAKINEVIYDSNVSTLPMIYGGKRVTYASPSESQTYINNNYNAINQGYDYSFGQQL